MNFKNQKSHLFAVDKVIIDRYKTKIMFVLFHLFIIPSEKDVTKICPITYAIISDKTL